MKAIGIMVALALAGVVAWLWLRSRKAAAADGSADHPYQFHTADGNSVLVNPGDPLPDGSGAIFQPVQHETSVMIDNGKGDMVSVTQSSLTAAKDGAFAYDPFTADAQARTADAIARDAREKELAAADGLVVQQARDARAAQQAADDAAEWARINALAATPIVPSVPLDGEAARAAAMSAGMAAAIPQKKQAKKESYNQDNYAALAAAGPAATNQQPPGTYWNYATGKWEAMYF